MKWTARDDNFVGGQEQRRGKRRRSRFRSDEGYISTGNRPKDSSEHGADHDTSVSMHGVTWPELPDTPARCLLACSSLPSKKFSFKLASVQS